MSDGMPDGAVVQLPFDAFVERAGSAVNATLTIVAAREAGDGAMRWYVLKMPGGLHQRVMLTLAQMERLRAIAEQEGMILDEGRQVIIQGEDVPVDVPGISWEMLADWRHIRLIPDLYYLMGDGYEDFAPEPVPWHQRLPSVVWRGSSTGLFNQVPDDLDRLPRYRLCRLAASLGASADAGITDVVQGANEEEAARIRARLAAEGLLRPFLPIEQMSRYRHILDIDGNSNSWNFIMKLRLGCCVLRVESSWRQWFSDRLIPWTHYVPVSGDLSDLIERADWCLAHPAECADIAENGRAFAIGMSFTDEVAQAARLVFGPETSPA